MLFLHHGLHPKPNLHLAERTHALANGLGVVGLTAKLLVEAAVHPEKQPSEVPDSLEALRVEMARQGKEYAFVAAFGPTGVLGRDIQLATLPESSNNAEAKTT